MIISAVKEQLQEKNVIKLDVLVARNFREVNLVSIYHPILILVSIAVYFYLMEGGNFIDNYINSQKELFYFINDQLSVYPNLFYNITQLGDALIIFPFVFIFLVIAPKFWEALLTSSIFTLITSAFLKRVFAMPRPAAMFDIDTFSIMGRPNILNTSLPSGHSMTVFVVITILMYAFMPRKKLQRVFWSLALILIGLVIAFSRVAVGAHYPIDVVLGSAIGYLLAVLSIKINATIDWLYWMKNERFYPIIMLILSIWTYLVVLKIMKHNLVVSYLSLMALIATFLVIASKYVKKNKA